MWFYTFLNLTAVITIVVCFNTGVQTPWSWQSSAKTCRNNLITLLFYIYLTCAYVGFTRVVTMHTMNNVKTHLIYCVTELVHPAWSHHTAVFIMSIHSFHPLTVHRGGSYSVFLLLLSWTSQLSQEVPAVAASYAKKLPCSAEQQKKDPAHHSAATSTFLSLSVSIISYSWSIMCRMLHTLSFNIWWYVSGLYDIRSLKMQHITTIHETCLW